MSRGLGDVYKRQLLGSLLGTHRRCAAYAGNVSPPFAPEGRSWFPLSPLTGFPNDPFGHFFGNFSKTFFSRLMLRSFRSVRVDIPSRTEDGGERQPAAKKCRG